MATLEKIRNRMGVLVAVIIGLSLLAFVLGDFFDSRQSFMNRSQMDIGEMNGKSIRIDEFSNKVEETTNIFKSMYNIQNMDEEMQNNVRESVWQQYITEYVVGSELEELGIQVTPEELYDMVQGANPHPMVRQFFTNPETGQYNSTLAVQFLKALNAKQLNEDQERMWFFLEKEMLREKLVSKYMALINKSMFVTSLQSQEEYQNSARRANVQFIQLRYADVADSSIVVKDSDLKKFFKAHQGEFQQETSRDLEYVAFEIQPSRADYESAEKWMNDIAPEFISSESAKDFVNANSDVGFDEKNYKKGELTGVADSFAFAARLNETYGPVFEEESYKMFRLAEINMLPDSVKARHILIQPTANSPEAVAQAKKLADSLVAVLEKNSSQFAALALQYSTDRGSSEKGGDLGWFTEGKMVKPFNDASFSQKVGEVKLVESQFGYHILQVTERGKEVKKVKLATLVRKVDPSKETIDAIFETANKFAANNTETKDFAAAAQKELLIPRVAMNIRPNDTRISGLESPRELIRWAYQAEQGDVSGVIALENRFIVAHLVAAREKGLAEFEQVSSQLEARVRAEKKGEQLSEKIKTSLEKNQNMNDLAIDLHATVMEANGVSFAASTVGSAGFEPALVGAIAGTPANKLSEPVIGNTGVYVFFSTLVEEPKEADPMTLSYQKSRIQSMSAMRANYESLEALKDLAEIEDNRWKF